MLLSQQTIVFAQQASMIWDETTKSWVSTPTPPPVVATPPVQPQLQTQQFQQPAQIANIPVTTGGSTVDFGTLITVITPLIAGITGIFIKNKRDMEKNLKEEKEDTIKSIEATILPKLKQITPVAEQTAKQDVKISQIADELYKMMAEKANDIQGKPEIQQQKLLEDTIRSKIIAEQSKETSTPVWDEKTKSWISK